MATRNPHKPRMIVDRAMRAGVMVMNSTGYAWVILVLGLLVSAGLYFLIQARVESVARLRFENDTRDVETQIENRIRSYADVLYSVRGLFAVNPDVSRREFHEYVGSLNLAERFPGFQILNFERYVTSAERPAFEARVRHDTSLNSRGYPDFSIHPPGERPGYYVLTYLEPMQGNEASFGGDIGMNLYPTILRVMEHMRDANILISSGRQVRVDGPAQYVGLALRLPVYRRGAPIGTVEERRAAYLGSVGIGYRVQDSLKAIIDSATPLPVQFELFTIGVAGTPAAPERLVPDNLLSASAAPADTSNTRTSFFVTRSFQYGGRELAIRFSAGKGAYIDPLAQRANVIAFIGGVVITVLLSALMYSLARSRNQAQVLAEDMTAELHESEAFLAEAQRMSHTGSWLLEGDGRMRWSDQMRRMLGVEDASTPPSLAGFLDIVHPDDREALRATLWRCYERVEREEIRHRLRMADGAVLWIQTLLESTLIRGQRAVRGTSKDVTLAYNTSRRRETESAVIRALAVTLDVGNATQKVVELAAHGLGWNCGIAWAPDATGSALKSAAAWGADANAWSFLEQCRKSLLPMDDALIKRLRTARAPEWFDNIEARSGGKAQSEVPLRGQLLDAGFRRAVFVPVVVEARLLYLLQFCMQEYEPNREEMLVFLGRLGDQFAQYLQRRDTENRLKHVATHDSLTQLPNRATFHDRLVQALARARRHKYRLAVLFIDLDRFKVINDTMGHSAGDRLLQEAALRFKGCLREFDVIARLGGDEFVVLVDSATDPQQVTAVARRMLDITAKPFSVDGTEVTLGASIGISTYPDDAEDAETLLKNADIAMYRAKQEGRGNHQFYSSSLNQYSFERLQLEAGLRRGLGRKELRLHYQPKLDLASGMLASMEALLRWQRPGHGMVFPDQFIPIAEETGLVVPMGNWVLAEACAQLTEWDRAGMTASRVAVNLSARQFVDEALLDDIARIVREAGVEPERIEFELTESMVMRNAAQATATMSALKSMGFRLSIDDFGTGYSSLARLKRFPLDGLKLDRSFVKGLPEDQEDAAIARGVVALAHSLHLLVTAEGVETAAQFNFLKSIGCDEIQGFLIAKPMAPSDIPKLAGAGSKFKLLAPV
jgi:diguanylate cyclase (GGDEF)-like protein